jgi:hypothetical protein
LFVVECVDFPEGPDDPLPNKARVRIAKALFLFAFDPPPHPPIAAKALLPPSNHHRFAVVVVA